VKECRTSSLTRAHSISAEKRRLISFREGVRRASPEVFSDYLVSLGEGLGDLGDFEGFFALAVILLFFAVLWLIALGIASLAADVFSASGFQGLDLK
jgi:hypothetical protein